MCSVVGRSSSSTHDDVVYLSGPLKSPLPSSSVPFPIAITTSPWNENEYIGHLPIYSMVEKATYVYVRICGAYVFLL